VRGLGRKKRLLPTSSVSSPTVSGRSNERRFGTADSTARSTNWRDAVPAALPRRSPGLSVNAPITG